MMGGTDGGARVAAAASADPRGRRLAHPTGQQYAAWPAAATATAVALRPDPGRFHRAAGHRRRRRDHRMVDPLTERDRATPEVNATTSPEVPETVGQDVMKTAGPAVVRVLATTCAGTGEATGALIDGDRILTAASAVEQPLSIVIVTPDNQIRRANLLGTSADGVAVLQMIGSLDGERLSLAPRGSRSEGRACADRLHRGRSAGDQPHRFGGRSHGSERGHERDQARRPGRRQGRPGGRRGRRRTVQASTIVAAREAARVRRAEVDRDHRRSRRFVRGVAWTADRDRPGVAGREHSAGGGGPEAVRQLPDAGEQAQLPCVAGVVLRAAGQVDHSGEGSAQPPHVVLLRRQDHRGLPVRQGRRLRPDHVQRALLTGHHRRRRPAAATGWTTATTWSGRAAGSSSIRPFRWRNLRGAAKRSDRHPGPRTCTFWHNR